LVAGRFLIGGRLLAWDFIMQPGIFIKSSLDASISPIMQPIPNLLLHV